jgi:hypothetical protein
MMWSAAHIWQMGWELTVSVIVIGLCIVKYASLYKLPALSTVLLFIFMSAVIWPVILVFILINVCIGILEERNRMN